MMRLSRRSLLVLACAAAMLAPSAPPANAATAREQLNELAGRIAGAQTRLAAIARDARDVSAERKAATDALMRARVNVVQIARVMYMTGGLVAPGSEFSGDLRSAVDRSLYTEVIARGDRDIIERYVARERRLTALEGELRALYGRQASEVERLNAERRRLDSIFAKERARIRATRTRSAPATVAPVSGAGPFLVCPVDEPRAYTDDYGDPRGCCRRHEGNDILAPRGTPVRAPFPGRAVAKTNSAGGLTVKVYGARGYVYNAHLNSLGTLGSVAAGTVIGYVGDSGNASGGPTHNHFEWHPGGGGPVNPYTYLNMVC